MRYGILVGDRHYKFLAFGNSQFREHGAYFFASTSHVSANSIRAWMGYFYDIRIIAKHAARLGQCFSTTRAVVNTTVRIREHPDIERNGFVFSDGVGRISDYLSTLIQGGLAIKTLSGLPPSVYQFRLGGCKGILAVSPNAEDKDTWIRPSQYKFPAQHNGLEIIRWSQFSAAALNRQLIIVLDGLGVESDIFMAKLREQLSELDMAMEQESVAQHLLSKFVDPNQMTLTVASMITDGFHATKEPFLTSILHLWRAWSIKYLKEKAKINIEQGACVLGTIDETGTLKGHFNEKQPGPGATYDEMEKTLPEIFIQVPDPENSKGFVLIEGVCLLARNPSLHPGDIRIVMAVDNPELYHLRDVVVLPSTGDRDIANMCSGGDLDGDDYLVIWDQELVPKKWNLTPMDYTAPKAKDLDRNVTVGDVTDFFVQYMRNDSLSSVALAHLAWADQLDDGVFGDRCKSHVAQSLFQG